MAIPTDLTRFITINRTSTEQPKYEVVLKSFPQVQDEKIVYLVKSKTLATGPDKGVAEAAAKIFAQCYGISYVPEATSVITIAPCGGNTFMAIELRSDDHPLGINHTFQDLTQATLNAYRRKNETGMDIVTPVWMKMDGSMLRYPKWVLGHEDKGI